MTTRSLQELGKHGDFKISPESQTVWESKGSTEKEAKTHTSSVVKRKGKNTQLRLHDTVGFGADDMKSSDILEKTVLNVASKMEKVRGCIFVHKCKRFRTGGAKDID